MPDPVCLVTGVGPGTGAAITRRFAKGGYRVAMLARRLERLQMLESEIESARAYQADVTDRERLTEVFATVATELGRPKVIVHNAVRGTFGNVLDLDPRRSRGELSCQRARAPASDADRRPCHARGRRRRDHHHRQHGGAARASRLRGFRSNEGKRNAFLPSQWQGTWGRKAFMSRT